MKLAFALVVSVIFGFFVAFILHGYRSSLLDVGATVSPLSQVTPVIISTPAPSYSIDVAPQNSLRGQIASMSGTILWQSRSATEPAQITQPQEIQQGEELVASDDGKLTVNFTVGTISLSPKTTVDILQTLPVNLVFGQVSGTAQYTSIQNPFTVRTYETIAQISGGTLTVAVDEHEPFIHFVSQNAPVTIAYNDADFVSHIATIAAGRQFLFNRELRSGY